MEWSVYWGILRRRWWLVVGIVILDVLASGYLYRKAHAQIGSQACLTLYVADVSAPSLISAPPSTLLTAGQLLAGETAANFFADDILDVAQSRIVASYMLRRGVSTGSVASNENFDGTVGGSRRDRTVDLCVTKPNAAVALAGAEALGTAMTKERARFVGPAMAKRTYVNLISPPVVTPGPTSHAQQNLLLRIALGILVALGIAFLWDALDPTRGNEVSSSRT